MSHARTDPQKEKKNGGLAMCLSGCHPLSHCLSSVSVFKEDMEVCSENSQGPKQVHVQLLFSKETTLSVTTDLGREKKTKEKHGNVEEHRHKTSHNTQV